MTFCPFCDKICLLSNQKSTCHLFYCEFSQVSVSVSVSPYCTVFVFGDTACFLRGFSETAVICSCIRDSMEVRRSSTDFNVSSSDTDRLAALATAAEHFGIRGLRGFFCFVSLGCCSESSESMAESIGTGLCGLGSLSVCSDDAKMSAGMVSWYLC